MSMYICTYIHTYIHIITYIYIYRYAKNPQHMTASNLCQVRPGDGRRLASDWLVDWELTVEQTTENSTEAEETVTSVPR